MSEASIRPRLVGRMTLPIHVSKVLTYSYPTEAILGKIHSVTSSARPRLDKRDALILRVLQQDSRTTNAALAKQLHIAEAPAWRRVKALEERGVIRGYRAVLSRQALGFEVTAFVRVRFYSHAKELQDAFELQVSQMEEVVWCHNVSGSTDFLLCAVARSLQEYGEVVSTRLRLLPGVTSIESMFSLKTVKDDHGLPVE